MTRHELNMAISATLERIASMLVESLPERRDQLLMMRAHLFDACAMHNMEIALNIVQRAMNVIDDNIMGVSMPASAIHDHNRRFTPVAAGVPNA